MIDDCKLNILTDLPNNLLELDPKQLHTVLSGPTLIHLNGRREQPYLFPCCYMVTKILVG